MGAASNWIERYPRTTAFLMPIVLGLVFCTGFDPVGWRWSAFFALVGFGLWFQTRRTVSAAAVAGFCFGLGWFVPGLSWTMHSIAVHGRLPWAVAALALLLLGAALSLFPAVAGALARRTAGEHDGRALFSLAGFFVIAEWLRGETIAHFGWLSPGYALLGTPLEGWAPLGGVYAVTLITVLAAVMTAQALSCRLKWLWLPVLGVAVIFGVGQTARQHDWSEPSATVDVRVLQPALPVVDGYTKADAAARIRTLFAAAEKPWPPSDRPRLLLTPEGVVNGLINRLSPDAAGALIVLQEKAEAPVLFNGFRQEGRRYFNTSFVLGEGRVIYRLDKRKLVPFGEYVPSGARWFVDLLGIPMTDLTPGDEVQPLLALGQAHAGILICYENLYGSVVRRLWRTHSPDFLIVTSNLGWFGRNVLTQHLAMSRMRALESARPVLSVNNNGLSAVVNSKGAVVKSMKADAPDAMTLPLLGATGSPTPYIRLGDWPALILGLILAFNGFWTSRIALKLRELRKQGI